MAVVSYDLHIIIKRVDVQLFDRDGFVPYAQNYLKTMAGRIKGFAHLEFVETKNFDEDKIKIIYHISLVNTECPVTKFFPEEFRRNGIIAVLGEYSFIKNIITYGNVLAV